VTTTEVLGLKPQRPRFHREFAESSEYILEPSWQGTRALVTVGERAGAVGYGGSPVDIPRELLDAIGAVTDARSAVIDGVLVPGFVEEGELEGGEGDEAFLKRPVPRDVFVAVDLLEVDGTSLLDAPLLERKRHLAGILRPSTNVRLSPFVRRGMRAWRDTLEAQGFRRFVVKKVNSRYRPGETNDDWLQIEKL
jgi:bifunctional non-homologous end joining protein LigD